MTAILNTLATLKMAEDFMSGFEGDEMQQGVDAKLAAIRAAIARIDVASTLEPAGEASAPQYVMMHKITRWVDQSGLIIEEHAEDAEPDSDSAMLWDVWVRAGEHGQQPEEIESYGGQFETREAALIYATKLASILDIEVDEY